MARSARKALYIGPLPQDQELIITRSQLTALLLESHRKSANAAEEVLCLKEIGKINGLYESSKPRVTINLQQNAKQLETMSDQELMLLAGSPHSLFDTPLPIEYTEVKDITPDE